MGRNPRKTAMGLVVLVAVLGPAAWRLLAPVAYAGRCDLSAQACLVSLEDQELVVELIPRHPASGEAFRLRLNPATGLLPEFDGEEIVVDFSMPGMEMGEQVMTLEVIDRGVMEGRIALPTCPMGQSLWQVSIRVGQVPTADMVLHVGE